MTIPIEVVHKSHAVTAKGCLAKLRFQDIWKIPPPFVNESGLAGSAFHDAVEDYHRYQIQARRDGTFEDENSILDDAKYWFEKFVSNFHRRKESTTKAGIKINTADDIKAEDFAVMINGYIKKSYNRYAEPILIETKFYFEIQRGHKVYKFAGTIDQLLKIKLEHLPFNPNDVDVAKKGYVYLHRDIKTGKKNDPGMLEVNDDINLYSYALAFGAFDLDGDGICEQRINLIPFAHCLYFVRDHIPYLKSGKTKSGRVYKAGEDRGSGMQFVKRTYNQLKAIEDELIETHKYVNCGVYPRIGKLHNMCVNYCAYKEPCFKDLIGEM